MRNFLYIFVTFGAFILRDRVLSPFYISMRILTKEHLLFFSVSRLAWPEALHELYVETQRQHKGNPMDP